MDTITFLRKVLLRIASAASQGAAYANWSDDFARKEVIEEWKDERTSSRKPLEKRVTIADLKGVNQVELIKVGFQKWDDKLMLIPLWAYNYIADGEELISIMGDVKIKGRDETNLDTRGGMLAWGFNVV